MQCNLCNKEFEKTIHNKKYCSFQCNQSAYKLRHPHRILEASKRWRLNNPGRYMEVIHKYRETEKGKIATRKAALQWLKTTRGRILRKKYCGSLKVQMARKAWLKTENGRKYKSKKYSKRKRNLNFIPIMDNPFSQEIKINWHHINNLLVVPIPEGLHKLHLGETEQHRTKCNKLLDNLGFNLKEFTKV